MLAVCRCEEISEIAFEKYKEGLFKFSAPLGTNELITAFAVGAEQLINNYLEMYDNQAKRYIAEIYNKKRATLVDKMCESLNTHFQKQIKLILNEAQNEFNTSLKKPITRRETCL